MIIGRTFPIPIYRGTKRNHKEHKEKTMELEQAVVFLVIGGIAGWLAGLILKRGGLGLIGNIIIGILGAILGGWLHSGRGCLEYEDLAGTRRW